MAEATIYGETKAKGKVKKGWLKGWVGHPHYFGQCSTRTQRARERAPHTFLLGHLHNF